MLGTNLLLTACELWNQNPRFFSKINEATNQPMVCHVSFNTLGKMNIYMDQLMHNYV